MQLNSWTKDLLHKLDQTNLKNWQLSHIQLYIFRFPIISISNINTIFFAFPLEALLFYGGLSGYGSDITTFACSEEQAHQKSIEISTND